MATENVEDWDEPVEMSYIELRDAKHKTWEEKRRQKNMEKLKKYVNRMSYKPVPPPPNRDTRELGNPKIRSLVGTYTDHKDHLSPTQRAQRLKRSVRDTTAISTEQLEQIIKQHKSKEKKKEVFQKRKQELYYEMLTKLERQCRTQYLNVLIKKFANFIAKLATTMRIPPQLMEPYARMQRAIFCNILLAIGIQPTSQSSIYYGTHEAQEYQVCHKLAHALVSLIIKGLDSAATKNPEDIGISEQDFEMDNYIKDRLMCAAEKKILNERSHPKPNNQETVIVKNCSDY